MMMAEKQFYVVDTNVLLNYLEVLENYPLVVTSHVLRELEKIESMSWKYGEQSFRARQARRMIKSKKDKIHLDLKDYVWDIDNDFDSGYEDNRILKACIENGYGIITFDGLMAEKAQLHNVPFLNVEEDLNKEDDYTGYKEVKMTEEQIKEFEQGLMSYKNPYGLLENQYIVALDKDGKPFEAFRWDGEYYHSLTGRKKLKTKMFGEFTPYDIYQKIAIDSLSSNQMTMLHGNAGTGKSLIALNYSMHQLENNKIDKIIFFVNPNATKNSVKLGFYTGSKDEKLLQSSVGNMLASKFGDKLILEAMIQRQEILLLPFSDIRGFDSTGMNAIIHILEAQNLDKELMKLAIQRVGSDSKLIIDGDFTSQVDDKAYEGANNGMVRASEVFRGTEYYGQVKLPIIYRSKLAEQAELM